MDVEQAFRSYGHSVLRRARRLLGDSQEAQEVLQEVFLDLLQQPDQFQGRSALSTFLYSVATHRCLNRLRDGRNRTRAIGGLPDPSATSPAAARADDYVIARQVLARLPEDQAFAAVYYYVDEMSHQEIAEMMGCSRRHVGDLLERTRASTRTRGEQDDARISRT